MQDEEEVDEFEMEDELEEGAAPEVEEDSGGRRRCGKGHHGSLLLDIPSYPYSKSNWNWNSSEEDQIEIEGEGGGSFCLGCFSALLSDPTSPCHHVSYALSQLLSLLANNNNNINHHHQLLAAAAHLLISPLVCALFCDSFTRDDALARQIIHLISFLSLHINTNTNTNNLHRITHDHVLSAAADFVVRIADRLSSPSGTVAWNNRLVYPLHCFGVLLESQHTGNQTPHIRDTTALFSNLVAALRLPSEEIRGEILFVLYMLFDTQVTPWDDAICDDAIHVDTSFTGLGHMLLRGSLEALFKTQHDDVRMNCLALLIVLAKRGFFEDVFANGESGENFGEANATQTELGELQTPLINLFADAVKGPLLSSDFQVQTRTLSLILTSLSSDVHLLEQIQILVEENVGDYVFEILRLSGNKDSLVTSCVQVLVLLATAQETFRQRLAIGFPTLLSVLHHVSDIPLHPAESQVLELVWKCMLDCPGIITKVQIEELALILSKIFARHATGELGLQSDTLILACMSFVEILKLAHASLVPKLDVIIQEALRNLISSSVSISGGISNQLLLSSLHLLKEAQLYSLHNLISENKKLEKSLIETCKTYLLPWLESSVDEGVAEEVILDVLETFHLILLRGSKIEAQMFAEFLASSSWFSLSFRCMGLFPSDEMKSRVYLMLSSIIDRTMNNEFGHCIRDAHLQLPSDPLELLFLLGQKSSSDHKLIRCQHAVLLILYVGSLCGESLADQNQVLASLEQYVIVNNSNFSCGAADSVTLTQLILLYGHIRGNLIGHMRQHSPEAEKTLFWLINEQECDILKMGAHPISLRWLFQQEEIQKPLLNQMLNFCRLHSTNNNQIYIPATEFLITDISMIAKLVISGDNNIALLLVTLLQQVHEECKLDDMVSVANVIAGILEIYPEASNQFCLHGISVILHSLCISLQFSSQTFHVLSLLIFKILSSANHRIISQDGGWFMLTTKLVEILVAKWASYSSGEEGCIILGIFCLILHHSTKHVLKEASLAILLNKSLVNVVDNLVQTACSKGPSLIDQEEAGMEDCLIFVLLLFFFALQSLYANFQETFDWQDFLQSSDDEVQLLPVICIKCHELCRMMYFGPPLVKLVASRCLMEVITRISDQRNMTHDEHRCSSNYLESILAVTEGLVFYGDSIVATNCSMCLSMILGWGNQSSLKSNAISSPKWFRLIVEEFVMTLAAPRLASKHFNTQHKPVACIVSALLRMDSSPHWMRSILDASCISQTVENLTAGNVSTELVTVLRMLVKQNYLKKEQVAWLHHLFQVCRKQVYEGASEGTLLNPSFDEEVAIPGPTGKICSMLLNLMLCPSGDCDALQTEHNRLLDEIDMFFRESSAL